jgi:hypothetical protein
VAHLGRLFANRLPGAILINRPRPRNPRAKIPASSDTTPEFIPQPIPEPKTIADEIAKFWAKQKKLNSFLAISDYNFYRFFK